MRYLFSPTPLVSVRNGSKELENMKCQVMHNDTVCRGAPGELFIGEEKHRPGVPAGDPFHIW